MHLVQNGREGLNTLTTAQTTGTAIGRPVLSSNSTRSAVLSCGHGSLFVLSFIFVATSLDSAAFAFVASEDLPSKVSLLDGID